MRIADFRIACGTEQDSGDIIPNSNPSNPLAVSFRYAALSACETNVFCQRLPRCVTPAFRSPGEGM